MGHRASLRADFGTGARHPDLPPLPEPTSRADKTVAELREEARAAGVEIPSGARKADIVEALDAAE